MEGQYRVDLTKPCQGKMTEVGVEEQIPLTERGEDAVKRSYIQIVN